MTLTREKCPIFGRVQIIARRARASLDWDNGVFTQFCKFNVHKISFFFGKSYAFRLGYEKKFLLRLIIIYLSLFVNVFLDGFCGEASPIVQTK
jgi:hypothetical protein